MATDDGPPEKRPKLGPEMVRCAYYVERKQRYCKMTVGRGKLLCGAHDGLDGGGAAAPVAPNPERVPCPYDGKHTVAVQRMQKHLRVCNARPVTQPAYIVPDVNGGSDGEQLPADRNHVRLADVPVEQLRALIERIGTIHGETVGDIEMLSPRHAVLDEELQNATYGPQTVKHLEQVSALLGLLAHRNLLQPNTAYVEFGAGKGQVAYWLAQAVQRDTTGPGKVVLVDRESHRHKKDNKIQDRNMVLRVRTDIADLLLDKLDTVRGCDRIVGIGKHLCGGATDMALRCLVRNANGGGCLFALCCHHRCTWRTYVGKRFLTEQRIDAADFALIVRMVSWAVCGTGGGSPDEHARDRLGLTIEQRELVGRQCKRILDVGRLRYLRDHGYDVDLKCYVRYETTPENVCLLGSRK